MAFHSFPRVSSLPNHYPKDFYDSLATGRNYFTTMHAAKVRINVGSRVRILKGSTSPSYPALAPT